MFYYIIFIVFIIDRFFKFLVSINIGYGESIEVLPFLDITYLSNSGIAFSLFTGNNNILLWLNLLIIIFLIFVLLTSYLQKSPVVTAYCFILGGALSNVWDRFFHGGVIDYIDFKIWPVFNIADTAISIGAVLIGFSIIKDMILISKNKIKS